MDIDAIYKKAKDEMDVAWKALCAAKLPPFTDTSKHPVLLAWYKARDNANAALVLQKHMSCPLEKRVEFRPDYTREEIEHHVRLIESVKTTVEKYVANNA
jgi:hypothetical protein